MRAIFSPIDLSTARSQYQLDECPAASLSAIRKMSESESIRPSYASTFPAPLRFCFQREYLLAQAAVKEGLLSSLRSASSRKKRCHARWDDAEAMLPIARQKRLISPRVHPRGTHLRSKRRRHAMKNGASARRQGSKRAPAKKHIYTLAPRHRRVTLAHERLAQAGHQSTRIVMMRLADDASVCALHTNSA